MKIIYVDLLVFVNMIVNFFILSATEKICKEKIKPIRMIISDIAASLCSLAIFLPELGVMFSIALRLAVSSTVVLAAFGFGNLRRFVGIVGGFFSVSFAYAGICLGIWTAFKPSKMIIKNDVVYFDISPIVLVSTAAICYVILWILKKHFVKNDLETCEYDVIINHNGATKDFKGFLDTGNLLCDSFSQRPVIIISGNAARELSVFTDSLNGTAQNLNGFRYIPYSVVGGKGILPAFVPDGITVKSKKFCGSADDCLLAVSDDLAGDYSVIFGKNVIERIKQHEKQTEPADIKN